MHAKFIFSRVNKYLIFFQCIRLLICTSSLSPWNNFQSDLKSWLSLFYIIIVPSKFYYITLMKSELFIFHINLVWHRKKHTETLVNKKTWWLCEKISEMFQQSGSRKWYLHYIKIAKFIYCFFFDFCSRSSSDRKSYRELYKF